MNYIRDAAESTIRRLLVQLDEAHMLVVERFVVEQCLAQQSGHQSGGSLAGLVGGESGNTRPNQAGADGNGAAGQPFSPVPGSEERQRCPRSRRRRWGVLLEWDMPGDVE